MLLSFKITEPIIIKDMELENWYKSLKSRWNCFRNARKYEKNI